MDINLFYLQKQTIESYNRLVLVLKKANKSPESGFVKINGDLLERTLGHLHNDLAFVGSLIDPDTGKAYLDGEKARMDCFEFEPEEDGDDTEKAVTNTYNFIKMDDNFKTFTKYKFNHGDENETGGSLPDALGLSEDFSDMVIKTMRKEEIDCDNWIQIFENTFNKVLPQNATEAFWIGWVAANLYEMKHPKNPMEALMRMMRDREKSILTV